MLQSSLRFVRGQQARAAVLASRAAVASSAAPGVVGQAQSAVPEMQTHKHHVGSDQQCSSRITSPYTTQAGAAAAAAPLVCRRFQSTAAAPAPSATSDARAGAVYSTGFAKQANASIMAVEGSTRVHIAVVSKPAQGWGADKGGLNVAYKERSSSSNMIPRGYVSRTTL